MREGRAVRDKRCAKLDDRGFTLIEFLAALAIFTIGILAFFSLSVQSARMSEESGMRAEAAFLVGEEMERLQREGWGALAADCRGGEVCEGCAEGLHRTVVKGGRRYRLLLEKETLDPFLDLVRITCYWDDKRGGFDSSRRLWLTTAKRSVP
jgi:prepilin-type N-terminal cleavage/methylation domain-containing protein